MNREIDMMTNDQALELIESALRTEPFCPCGEPTTIVTKGDELRLACASLNVAGGSLRRHLRVRFDLGHVSRVILQDPIVELAA